MVVWFKELEWETLAKILHAKLKLTFSRQNFSYGMFQRENSEKRWSKYETWLKINIKNCHKKLFFFFPWLLWSLAVSIRLMVKEHLHLLVVSYSHSNFKQFSRIEREDWKWKSKWKRQRKSFLPGTYGQRNCMENTSRNSWTANQIQSSIAFFLFQFTFPMHF